jgi:Restriction endonuclease/HB1, ASXL, restriction endonuclease HTH domain
MTYLEAAAAILKDAGEPLHYKAITTRALERGLIEPKGATPDATMGAQLYQAVKHAETDGEPCVFRQTGRGHFALAAKTVSAELDTDIAKHNVKLEGELLDFLHEMHPKQVELLIGQLLTAIGFEDVAVTKYSGDGGIDVDATLTVGGVTRVRTAIQVKRWKNNVSGSTVRELRGSLMTDQRGLIITTSAFTKDAIIEADAHGKAPISLLDGKRLIQLLVEKQIGVRRKAVHLLELNFAELVAGGDAGGDAAGEKSAVLWPLPGGRHAYFQTLLAFVDYINDAQPTVDEMTDWVKKHYEKVTKNKVVLSYLRNVLYSIGVIDFDGERIVLTEQGKHVHRSRKPEDVVTLMKDNIVGVEEILAAVTAKPQHTGALSEHLVKTLKLSWETDQQTRYRLHWPEACGAIKASDAGWTLAN